MPKKQSPRTAAREPDRQTVEVIDPRWMIKAVGGVLLAALVCAYATLCLLYYQGAWQLILHPSAVVSRDPGSLSLPFQAVRFGVDASGTPQLSGWWIPSGSESKTTALVLHDLSGNMADALDRAQLYHAAHLNVLLFDYRGYGSSGGPHPSEANMQIDARDALDYITKARGVPVEQVVICSEGGAAALAVHLAKQNPQVPALVLFNPAGDLEREARQDPRSRLVPASALIRDRFALATPMQTLATPKLIVTEQMSPYAPDPRSIADPKITVSLLRPASGEPLSSLHRFLDSYLNQPASTLKP